MDYIGLDSVLLADGGLVLFTLRDLEVTLLII